MKLDILGPLVIFILYLQEDYGDEVSLSEGPWFSGVTLARFTGSSGKCGLFLRNLKALITCSFLVFMIKEWKRLKELSGI
ncbi:uncharacterized protein LAJ45_06561 [Morchella importuna]|uniref:uncharacterized protein n=1 Tax=Morchella importuna TaxID=1174673 RepID=UPI001E8DEAB9|nr:uncharacterized protein LAJ45_06561 [Morchella importuna]KAH8149481.1 hypothetical protein LAJ45_06561 [Morchella importuna]